MESQAIFQANSFHFRIDTLFVHSTKDRLLLLWGAPARELLPILCLLHGGGVHRDVLETAANSKLAALLFKSERRRRMCRVEVHRFPKYRNSEP